MASLPLPHPTDAAVIRPALAALGLRLDCRSGGHHDVDVPLRVSANFIYGNQNIMNVRSEVSLAAGGGAGMQEPWRALQRPLRVRGDLGNSTKIIARILQDGRHIASLRQPIDQLK